MAPPGDLGFDGIICFGGVDWWYHNRGHYDLQMMRELSARVPVLYVNSLGVRTPRPSEGRMFARRAARKLKSVLRGFRVVRPGFAVLSPPSVPFLRGNAAAEALTARAVRRGAAALGIERALVWINCPSAAELLPRLPHERLVYQRTDRFEAFPGVDPVRFGAWHRRLCEADLTLYCTAALFEEERAACRRAALVDHGVDYEHFAAADDRPEPADVAAIPRPRVGFVGGIDAHTFDPELFLAVARALPEHAFVLVGGCSLAEGWCTEPNVHLLGRRPYEEVAGYMAACDVLIMPWRQNDWIRACNPIKLKEYLAVGRPIVSTPFDELGRYAGLVAVARTAPEFAAGLQSVLANPTDRAAQRQRVAEETWSAKAAEVWTELGAPSQAAAEVALA